MSDLPPADWYHDPDDDRQYRYWDGESWTEHYTPRRIGNKPRPTGELIDADYFSSINFDPGLGVLGRAALGSLLMVVAPVFGIASVARAAVASLRGRTPTTSDALQGGLGRLGRLFGVWLQIWTAIVMVSLIVVVSAFLSVLLFLAAVALGVASFPVLGLAGATAAIGPKGPSPRYTLSLVNDTPAGSGSLTACRPAASSTQSPRKETTMATPPPRKQAGCAA